MRINVMEIFEKESVFDQLKRIRSAMMSGGLFPLSLKVKESDWYKKYDVYRWSKVKKYRSMK